MNFVNFGGLNDEKLVNLDNVLTIEPSTSTLVGTDTVVYTIYVLCLNGGFNRFRYESKEDRDENFERVKEWILKC